MAAEGNVSALASYSVRESFLKYKKKYLWEKSRQLLIDKDPDKIRDLDLHILFDSSHRKNTPLHIAARIGSKEIVEKLLIEDGSASLLTKKNSRHDTPLHIAARSGHVHVVKSLIHKLANTGDVEARRNNNQVLSMRNMEGNTPLHEAVRNGHLSIVRVLLAANDSDLLVSRNNAGESPLSMAVDVWASEIVRTILQSNPTSLSYRSPDGQTLLHRAILRADLETMKIILPDLPNPNLPNPDLPNPDLPNPNLPNPDLPNPNLPNLLNEKDNRGRSPLHYAAASGALDMVYELLRRKPANESFLDDNLATPAHMAAENGHLNVLTSLVKCCPYCSESLNNQHQNILHVAAQNGHLKVVRHILNMFMVNDLLNETDMDGNTPLHLAAAKLHFSIISTLIQTGNVNTRAINNRGETALDIARKFQLVEPSNENKTGCAREEYIEAKKQRTIEILKAASAKQAEKLEGILEQEDLIIESKRHKRRKEMAGPLIIMATLVATVTFTAAFTIPGGVQSEGPHQGMAVLTRKAAFKAFIVTDTIAMTTAMAAAVILSLSSWIDEINNLNTHGSALTMLGVSLVAMGLAFVTGLFTVLSDSTELAIMVCVIGCLFPALVYLLWGVFLQEDIGLSPEDTVESFLISTNNK